MFKLEDKVWIKNLKVKGVVKDINEKENKTKVTFFNKGDKRISAWFKNSELKEYAPSHKSKTNASLKDMEVSLTKLMRHNVAIREKISEAMKQLSINSIEPLQIKVKYFADIEPLQKIEKGNWIDLRSAVDIELKKGQFALIPLGVGMKLPEGYEANPVPRSSTYKNFGIIQTNHFGVIDNSYSGNEDQWHFPALATRDTVIKKNDRICQFRIQEVMPEVEFVTVNELDEVSRGGFGSTGKN